MKYSGAILLMLVGGSYAQAPKGKGAGGSAGGCSPLEMVIGRISVV